VNTITWSEFYQSFAVISKYNHHYRLGQHFINMFVKDSNSDEVFEGLWESDSFDAHAIINKVIEKYQWDLLKLPVVDRGEQL
jgi:hypothetical protein